MSHRYPLLIVLAVAALLRIAFLDLYPPSLFGDEVDVGYHAYSLLHTGRDYMGQLLPTYIHSFSEWRAPLLMYATVPFVGIFGLNEWGVRLAPAFFGIVSVLFTYLFVQKLTGSRAVGLATAGLLAITPWHIHYSRSAYEVTLLLALLVIGLWAFLKSFENRTWLYLSAATLALMFYAYSVATVFVPLLVLGLGLIYRKELFTVPKQLLGSGLLFILIILPFVFNTVTGITGERFSLISIGSDPQLVNQIEIQRNTVSFPSDSPFAGFNQLSEKFAHNRPLAVAQVFMANYFAAFSPQFLFLTGDPNPRQSVGNFGQLYIFEAILLGFGLYFLCKRSGKSAAVVLLLLVLAPIPAAMTQGGGMHATRLFLLVLPITIVAGFGLANLVWAAKAKLGWQLVLGGIGVLAVVHIFLYVHQFLAHSPNQSYKFWQYGYGDSLRAVKELEGNYNRILITNTKDPLLTHTMFYLQYPPDQLHKIFTGDRPQPNIQPGFDGFSVGNISFVTRMDPSANIADLIDPQTLYLLTQEKEVGGDWDWRKDPPAGIQVLHTTLDPDNNPMYYVITKL